MIDVAKLARVEPLTIIDSDCMHLDYMPDIMQSLQAIFSGYYLQAASFMGTIGGVTLAKKLAPLNPNASYDPFDWRMSTEAYTYRLPTTHNHRSISMEKAEGATLAIDKKEVSTIKEAVNLSVGKMYNVSLKHGEQTAVIPVSIRLLANSMPSSAIVNMFTFKNSFDMDMTERYHSWKAGRLSFFKDLILCSDLIDKHRKNLLKDNNDVYKTILTRENSTKLNGLITRNPSVAVASTLAIISTDTLADIEQKLLAKVKDFKTRQTIFDNTNLMILVVIDKAWERVTFYHRGINEHTTVGIKDIKQGNKGDGQNVTDIMKAYLAGSSPKY